jgi:large subunit ribosomal protein L23
MQQIIIRPVLTEKSLTLASRGWYTFEVDLDAEKPGIASELSRTYGVTVTDVRTIRMHGKTRRTGRKMKQVQKSDWKKAMVQLKSGQTIDAFHIAPEEAAK